MNVQNLAARKSSYPEARIRYDSLRFAIKSFGFHLNFDFGHLKLIGI